MLSDLYFIVFVISEVFFKYSSRVSGGDPPGKMATQKVIVSIGLRTFTIDKSGDINYNRHWRPTTSPPPSIEGWQENGIKGGREAIGAVSTDINQNKPGYYFIIP